MAGVVKGIAISWSLPSIDPGVDPVAVHHGPGLAPGVETVGSTTTGALAVATGTETETEIGRFVIPTAGGARTSDRRPIGTIDGVTLDGTTDPGALHPRIASWPSASKPPPPPT